MRPLIINGINELATRADLLDRAEKEGYVVAAGHFHPDDHIGKVVLQEGKRFWQVL